MEIEIRHIQCESCAMALRRFIGRLKGVVSVEMEKEKLTIHFDSEKISNFRLLQILKDSLEKLGHSFKKKGGLS